jgi:hypothetical protein
LRISVDLHQAERFGGALASVCVWRFQRYRIDGLGGGIAGDGQQRGGPREVELGLVAHDGSPTWWYLLVAKVTGAATPGEAMKQLQTSEKTWHPAYGLSGGYSVTQP